MAQRKTSQPKRQNNYTQKDEEQLSAREGFEWGVALVAVVTALVMVISYVSFLEGGPVAEVNWLGSLGMWVAHEVMEVSFGVATLFVPVFLCAVALRVVHIGHLRLWKWFVNCSLLMVWFSVFGAWLQQWKPFEAFFLYGGMHGVSALNVLTDKTGPAGTFIIIVASASLLILYFSGETIHLIRRGIAIARRKAERQQAITDQPVEEEDETAELFDEVAASHSEDVVDYDTSTTIDFDSPNTAEDTSEEPAFVEQEMEIVAPQEEEPAEDMVVKLGDDEPEAELDGTRALEPYDPKLDLSNYRYPTIDLLDHYDGVTNSAVDMDEQKKNRDQIVSALKTYGVEITSIKATVGPTVTLYELTPAPGVRIAKIRNLSDDIALSLCALGIRIIAPIPGKGTVGIEVPNKKPQMVSMESLVNSRKFQDSEYELPIAIGKTITNEIFMVDLAKMPHLLVAGATGQGKSVGLNAIITSLLYKKHPAELKFVMVDPKKVEFSVYYPIVNHFLAQVEGTEDTDEPIITDVTKVIQTLKSLCVEMDTRYDLLKRARVRNIKEYNAKFKDRMLNPENGHRFMPYIVVIIDEFGDLIMTAGKEIEMPIARIAQKARAVGMHMIIATQRPDAKIITGSIKANFPARIAFKVAQGIDSKTVLDRPGANNLVGKGDMLFLAGTEPVRVQCAFVDTPEVERISNFIAAQQSYNGPMLLPHVEMEGEESGANDVDLNNLDPMFDVVAELVVSTQQGSTSMIQRKFSIGYNRAGRLMDQLEKAGIVGPAHGSKPREVLVAGIDELTNKLQNLR